MTAETVCVLTFILCCGVPVLVCGVSAWRSMR